MIWVPLVIAWIFIALSFYSSWKLRRGDLGSFFGIIALALIAGSVAFQAAS